MQVGLALSGGAARGIAHLGVLKAFDELGIKPSIISGVSSGAIAGVFYAAGYSPDDILKLIKELKIFSIVRLAIGQIGILHLEAVEKLFCKYLGEAATFEDLQVPVVVSATEMNEGVTAYFSSGDLIKPLLASCAVPILYRPIAYKGMLLNDGGLLNNMPLDPLEGNCDFKIGVHTNPVNHQARITSLRSMIERTAHLAINNNVMLRMHKCDFFIEPPELKYFRLMSFSKADEMFDIGYRYTLSLKDQLLGKLMLEDN
ncbi:patatin-like phospholipase family protein [Pontibacter sp. JH31]|uniref:Patatin-like phospholipase family protein n=1 Tax=Pontibacter aquaedesilientis TaxID=2766980 RepID=A0ABR7XDA5_9BACT|nr:patatin-like phospholipase family protein [Pontibacter aquaedesilientis]MBD1396278.1 patatin-like phospholipase family protein [Pontibacter aquaedesilientis]